MENTIGDYWTALKDTLTSGRLSAFSESLNYQRVVNEAAKIGYSVEDAFVDAAKPEQQLAQPTADRAEKAIPNPTLDRDMDQPRLSLKL